MLTKEEIEFVQLVLSRCTYTGIPNALAQYLEMYVQVIKKLEVMKNKTKEPEQLPMEGVDV